ncbi:hypothetical protein C8F01DRAFT_268664 [Mycena amicta]|nr:hypothetical protein C8F01DRAFT_268664 [Mycena amicta]
MHYPIPTPVQEAHRVAKLYLLRLSQARNRFISFHFLPDLPDLGPRSAHIGILWRWGHLHCGAPSSLTRASTKMKLRDSFVSPKVAVLFGYPLPIMFCSADLSPWKMYHTPSLVEILQRRIRERRPSQLKFRVLFHLPMLQSIMHPSATPVLAGPSRTSSLIIEIHRLHQGLLDRHCSTALDSSEAARLRLDPGVSSLFLSDLLPLGYVDLPTGYISDSKSPH